MSTWKDKNEPAAQETSGAGKHSSGSTSCEGYKLEVRSTIDDARLIRFGPYEVPLDAYWREVPIRPMNPIDGAINFPMNEVFRDHAAEHGVMSYAAAESLRWALHACAGWCGCIETRFVKVNYQETYSVTEIGVMPAVRTPRFSTCYPPVEPRALVARMTEVEKP